MPSSGLRRSTPRVGEELNELELAKGTRGQLRGKPKGSGSSGRADVEPPDGDAPTYAKIGEQRDFVAWWKGNVGAGKGQKENAANTAFCPKAKPKQLTGMAHQRVAEPEALTH